MTTQHQLRNYLHDMLSMAADDIHEGGPDSGYYLHDGDDPDNNYTQEFIEGIANINFNAGPQAPWEFGVWINGEYLRVIVATGSTP